MVWSDSVTLPEPPPVSFPLLPTWPLCVSVEPCDPWMVVHVVVPFSKVQVGPEFTANAGSAAVNDRVSAKRAAMINIWMRLRICISFSFLLCLHI